MAASGAVWRDQLSLQEIAHPGCAAGGQDGKFRLWDTRAYSNPGKVKLHAGPKGSGAVSGIVMGAMRDAAHVTAASGACAAGEPV